jgi:amino acid permease
MLSLPSALAVVGIVPAVILIIFLGAFGLFTAKLLIDFKLNHPDVHNMGDAGYLLVSRVSRQQDTILIVSRTDISSAP